LYTPGVRFSDSVFDPPWKVSVAPTCDPEDDATVKLWLSGAALANAIVTLPALAGSELLVYFS